MTAMTANCQHSPSSWCEDISHAQLANIVMMSPTSKTFGEDICKLFTGLHKWDTNHSTAQFLLDEVSVNFNMLSSFMLYWIMSNTDGCLIITVKPQRICRLKSKISQ